MERGDPIPSGSAGAGPRDLEGETDEYGARYSVLSCPRLGQRSFENFTPPTVRALRRPLQNVIRHGWI